MVTTSIISVNFNQPDATLDFLQSVKETTVKDSIELILVDNGSCEDHSEAFIKMYPELIYIRSEQNLGFAGGNNLGIKVAKGQFLLFLNNDTELSENFIEIMINEFEENPKIGLLSPLIMYYDDKEKIQYSGFTKMNYLTGRNKHQKKCRELSYETGFIHGAAMMCKRTDLDITGLMDENYFLYYEELDWCEKFRKAGKKIWFTGRTKIYHKESISVGKASPLKTYFMSRNRILFIRKNSSQLNVFLFSVYYVSFALPKFIIDAVLQKRQKLIPWVFKAIIWNIKNSKNSMHLGYNQ